jgi:hypothetical protein
MIIAKYVSLFLWTLLLLGVVFYIIKHIAFSKGKASEEINTSEAMYLASLIIAVGLVFQKVVQSIAIAFDNILKIQPGQLFFQSIKTSSAISVIGILIFIISFYVAKFFTSLFFGKRKDVIEFNADNKSFALVRGAILLAVSFVFLQVSESMFTYLIPTVTTPFYR